MLTLPFTVATNLRNNCLRYCFLPITFILIVALPAFAVSPGTAVKTVVRVDAKSGRLVRSVVPQRAAVPAVEAAELDEMVNRIAGEQGVESPLVHSVIRAESNYNPNAVSPKGAQGIMQLIPATAKRFGVSNAFDPEENIQGGVRYLRFLLDYYRGDYVRAIAAYNAGEAAVDKYHGVPPFAETRDYVDRVARNLEAARHGQAASAPSLVAKAADTMNTETFRPIQTSIGSDGRIYYRNP